MSCAYIIKGIMDLKAKNIFAMAAKIYILLKSEMGHVVESQVKINKLKYGGCTYLYS